MKIKTVNTVCRAMCIFNLATGTKKHIIKTLLCTVLLGTFAIGHNHAGTWRDEFDGNELNGWERIFEEDPWFVEWELIDEPFRLFGSIFMPKEADVTAADFLHWNAHPFQLDKLKVVGEEIRYPRHAPDISGELCLFLGKQQATPDFATGYIVSPERVTKMQFTEWGL